MTSVYALMELVQTVLFNCLFATLKVVQTVWHFFENYGWHVTLASVVVYFVMRRFLQEKERRYSIRSRQEASDPSRVAALNARRSQCVENMQTASLVASQKRRDRETHLRLRRIEELEKKILGKGHRLGTSF